MLIDYLRYVAFAGRLRGFFGDGLGNYVDPSATTGQHLRFAPDYLTEHFGLRIARESYWRRDDQERFLEDLKYSMGVSAVPDDLRASPVAIGGPPSTFTYRERRGVELEIIVDIDPAQWTGRYAERGSYEGVPIIYRKSGPARATFRSGEKILDKQRQRAGHGTLCGIFRSTAGSEFALTCGHVVANGSRFSVERRRRIWKLPLWSSFTDLGKTSHMTLPSIAATAANGPVRTHLDAAMIEIESAATQSSSPNSAFQAMFRPISTLFQEELVRFRGAGRVYDTLARVSAITVRKSMDLFKDGNLYDVGDVLMLGHRQPMYVVQHVSQRGDSGAAVRREFSRRYEEPKQWHGMILGSDEAGAYATYAEYLWAWAAEQIGDPDVEFVLET